MFTASGTDDWTCILSVGGGLKRVGEGEGDMCRESLLFGGCSPRLLLISRSLPLAENRPSSARFPNPLRPGVDFVDSPASTKLPAGFGEGALITDGLGLEPAICSKWDRREDTGF